MTDSINRRLVPWVVNDALSHSLDVIRRAQEACEGTPDFFTIERLRVRVKELQASQEFSEVAVIGLRA